MSISLLLPEAQRLAGAGFSIVPVKADKLPLGGWTRNQQTIDPPEVLTSRFSSSMVTGFAAVTGEVSGGLVSIDFDLDKKADALEPFDLEREFVEPWLEAVSAVVDPSTIPCQRTGSGGFQFFVRCPAPGGNVKLARVPAHNKQGFHAVIETRGQGGYALLPPSLHPSGNTYAWQHLDLTDVPTLTQEQATALLNAARALGRMPLELAEQRRLTKGYEQRQDEQGEIIRAFNAEYDPADILERNGYTLVKGKYLSPDSTSGNPGVTVFKDAPLIYSHHGDALGDGKAHDAFDVFAYLEHDGDKKAAYEAAGKKLGLWREGGEVAFIGGSPNANAAPTEGAPWDEREPLPGLYPPVPSLPPEMIPEPLRPWLSDISERASLPLEFVTCPALVALSAVIGRSVGIHPKRRDDWLVVPNIWGGIVGRPGVMKSAAISEPTKPLRALAAKAREQFEEEQRDAEAEKSRLELEVSALKEQAKRDAKKGGISADFQTTMRGLITQLEEATVTERRYYTQDPTVEKLGELLQENPRGMLVLRDELAGWLRTLERSGREGEREFYLEAWNGTGGFTFDRIGRGTVHIDALTLTILGAIQPGKLEKYLDEAVAGGGGADGLLQRFQLVVYPDHVGEYKHVDRYPNSEARQRVNHIFEKLDTLDPAELGLDAQEGDIPALHFADEAQELFDVWRGELEQRLRGDELKHKPAFESHLSKYRSLMPSLALIFHLVAVADGTATGPVSLEAAQLAAAWCDYLEAHALKLYAREVSSHIKAAQLLALKLEEDRIADGAKVRDIYNASWEGLSDRETVLSGLEVLAEHKWLRIEEQMTGGRPSQVVRLHPELRKRA